jgi:hypothetical protein
MDAEIPDLVDVYFQPFVRALGNLVITFALAEAALLDLVAEMHGQHEHKAVAVLKAQNAKDQVLILASSLGLIGYDRHELLTALGGVDSKDSLLEANQIQGCFWGGSLGCERPVGFERRGVGTDGAADHRST